MAEAGEQHPAAAAAGATAGEPPRMTHNPIYDYPDPYANPRSGALVSPRNISLVGRLRLTQPVWLQLGINSAAALHILQREPPGTFLVRQSNTRQCQVLCLRLPDNSSPAFVTTYCLHQELAAVSLEGSDLTFPSLLHLVAAYCTIPDILPLPLHLPQPIQGASSCQQLEAIAHLGLEFWSSSLNIKGPSRPTPLVIPPTEDIVQDMPKDTQAQKFSGLACGKPHKAFAGQLHKDVGDRRHYFKSSVKVRVSTEAASPLSPPAAPPPPIPVGKKKNPPRPPGSQSPDCDPLPQVPPQPLVRSETYHVPRSKEQEPLGKFGSPFLLTPVLSSGQLLNVTEEEQPEIHGKDADFTFPSYEPS